MSAEGGVRHCRWLSTSGGHEQGCLDSGHGYGSLVARTLVRIAFTEMGLQRVAAVCRPGNIASIRVLEKAGLRREGLLRGAVVIRGERQDSLVFGRLVTD